MANGRQYAEGTSVPVDRSVAEIRRAVQGHGAASWVQAEHDDLAIVGFVLHGRQVRFAIRMPDPKDKAFRYTPQRRTERTDKQTREAYDAEVRRRWRQLALVIRAKLEAVAAGVVEFEQEFLAHFVVPGSGGATFYEHVAPRLAAALDGGDVGDLMPRALTAGGER